MVHVQSACPYTEELTGDAAVPEHAHHLVDPGIEFYWLRASIYNQCRPLLLSFYHAIRLMMKYQDAQLMCC
jgi:hypothetical protein